MQTGRYVLFTFGMFALAGAIPAAAADMEVSNCPVNKQWQDAYNKGDATAVAAFYAANAIEVTPEGIRVGPAAVKERIEGSLKQLKNAVIIATKCDVGSTVRWSSGTWKADSPQGPVGGFWTAIEAKDGDTWKMQNLTYNMPPPPPTK